MTFGFMLGAAAIMVLAISLIAMLFDVNTEGQMRALVEKQMAKVRVDLNSPDWRERLTKIADSPELAERGIGFEVFERRSRNRTWASRPDLPMPGEASSHDFRFIPSRPAPGSPYRILFAVPIGELEEEQNRRKVEFLALTALVIGLAGLGAWMLVGKILSPIDQLSRQASTASVDRMQVKLNPPSPDLEMIGLVDTLNGLLERLAQTSAMKGRFYAAASHELRTPLQALSGHLEVALTRSRTAEEYEDFIAEAHRQTVRLITLVKDLLLLHQLDTSPPTEGIEVDLAGTCEQFIDLLQPLFEVRELTVELVHSGPSEIKAFHSHAEILVRNLLENAAKYASRGTSIEVQITESPKEVRLEISNESKLAKEIDLDRIFEPFYRPDISRNSQTGGNGLGLAICQALASANGWSIQLRPKDGEVVVTVSFPKPLRGLNADEQPAQKAGGKLKTVKAAGPST